MSRLKYKLRKIQIAQLLAVVLMMSVLMVSTAYAIDRCGDPGPDLRPEKRKDVAVAIDIGCRGQNNPIIDMLFAFIRFLSAGVGIIVVGSIIVAGIQYTSSRGDPQATAAALKRIQNSIIALLLYIFAAALLNFIIPAGIFQ